MALVVPVAARLWYQSAFPLTLVAMVMSAGASLWALARVLEVGALHYHVAGWAPPLGIEVVVDHVSGFVAAVVTSVSTVVIIATRRWADREAGDRLGAYYGLVLLLMAGLTGIVVTGDLFNLFVFLEISSLAGYALVFMGGRAGMIAGFRYLILGSVGGSFYLLGVGFLYFSTGTLNMVEMQQILTEDATARSVQAGAVFIFTGLGMKMALVPLHLWLPDAYTFAPSSVNSLIAPVMTKVAAYAIIRMFLSVFPEGYLANVVPVADALLVLGLIGIVFGSVVAIAQKDIRRMLAYSSVGQLALIAAAIGIATPLGLIAALLHIMNHAVMKATLFLTAASVRLSTNVSGIDGFTGLGRRMPITMAAFALGAVGMIGIPPAAGFFSKWYAVQAGVETGDWVFIGVVLASTLLTAAYLFRILERVYFHPMHPEIAPAPHGASSDGGHADGPEAEPQSLAVPRGAAHDEEHDGPHEEEEDYAPRQESPLDVALPALLLGLATIALGLANAWIVANVLEPGVR